MIRCPRKVVLLASALFAAGAVLAAISWALCRTPYSDWSVTAEPASGAARGGRKDHFVELPASFDYEQYNGFFQADGGATRRGAAYRHNDGYRILINSENICQTERLFLIVLVCSRPENKSSRAIFRKTWASVLSHRGYDVRTVFLLGRAPNAEVQADVDIERAETGDVVQLDVVESYENLTLKTVLGLKYARTFCKRALFVMKTDDDVIVLYRNLVDYLLNLTVASSRYLYAGSVHRETKPIRDPDDKWYVSEAEFGPPLYPPYAGGSGYVLSMAAAELVIGASYEIHYLSMEDAFVGICAEKAGLSTLNEDAFQGFWFYISDCRFRRLITSHGWSPDAMSRVWQTLQSFELSRDVANKTCPPFDWLLDYYEYSDEEVERLYRKAIAEANEREA